MITLTYGLKKPESGDKGATLWTALQDDIAHIDAHTHNGTDSPKLSVQNLNVTTQAISHLNWAANGPAGHYRQTVTMPAGFTYDNFIIDFRKTTTGEKIYPTVEKVTSTTYFIYTIDNTLDVTAVYGV